MKQAVIVSAVRTAVGKAKRGALVDVRPDEMAAAVIEEALSRAAPVKARMSRTSSWAAPSPKRSRA